MNTTNHSELGTEIPTRRLLARDAGVVERSRVYRRGEALEIDTSSFYRITRHRVLFEEVELATLHRGRSYRMLFLLVLLGLISGALIAGYTANTGGTGAGAVAFWLVMPTLAGAILGFVLPDWVISIQSRRTWTRMRLGIRRGRAERLFAELIAAIRETQTRLAAERPVASVAHSPFAPPPKPQSPEPSEPQSGLAGFPTPPEPILPLPGDPEA